MIDNRNLLERHDFGTEEAIPLRLTFWYFEYLKRNILLNKPELFRDIKLAFSKIYSELSENIANSDGKDLVMIAIRECLLKKYKYNKNVCYDVDLGSLVEKITNSINEFYFLCDLTEKYEYYAHRFLFPMDMGEILKHIYSGSDVASIQTYGFAVAISRPKYGMHMVSDMSRVDDGVSTLCFTLNVLSEDFDFGNILKEISYQIAARRHFLMNRERIDSISSKELSLVTKRHMPKGLKLIKHSSDQSRAIGLWCWDELTFLSKLRVNLPYSSGIPALIPFEQRSDMDITNSDLLFDLIEKGLLRIH